MLWLKTKHLHVARHKELVRLHTVLAVAFRTSCSFWEILKAGPLCPVKQLFAAMSGRQAAPDEGEGPGLWIFSSDGECIQSSSRCIVSVEGSRVKGPVEGEGKKRAL